MARRTFSIIGAGAVGTALARRLSGRGFRVRFLAARTLPSARAAARRAGCGRPTADPVRAARGAGWVVLALPASGIRPMCLKLARAGAVGPGSRVVHVNGSLGREVLADAARAGARVAAAHPFQTFSGKDAPRQDGILWGIDADPAFGREVFRLVRALGGIPCRVPAGRRMTYHAAAVFAANHVVVQAAWAARLLARAGVPRRQAVRGVAAIMLQAAANVARQGLPGAITGPAARGETAVVRRQLAAVRAAGIGPEAASAYRACARAAARLGAARTA